MQLESNTDSQSDAEVTNGSVGTSLLELLTNQDLLKAEPKSDTKNGSVVSGLADLLITGDAGKSAPGAGTQADGEIGRTVAGLLQELGLGSEGRMSEALSKVVTAESHERGHAIKNVLKDGSFSQGTLDAIIEALQSHPKDGIKSIGHEIWLSRLYWMLERR